MPSLWMYDFHHFWLGAQAILHGLSPYTTFDFIGPYPLALLFVPLGLFPMPVAYGIFIVINLFLLWKVCHWKGLWALFSFPVAFGLFTGQVDLFLALLIPLGAPWTLPLVMVKPQLAWLVLPWFLTKLDRKGWIKAFGVGIAFLILSFLVNPAWVSEWLAAQPGITFYSRHASSLYWLIPASRMDIRVVITIIFSIVAFIAGFFMKTRRGSWVFLQLFQPLTNIYSASVLAEWIGPLEFLLSWLVVFASGGDVHNGMPLFVIALSILFRIHILPRILPDRLRGKLLFSLLLEQTPPNKKQGSPVS